MKGKLCAILCFFAIACALIIVPVLAANPSGVASITGASQTFASITVIGGTSTIPLIISQNNADNGIQLSVTTNVPFYITVGDSSGRTSNLGYMGNYTNAYVAAPLNTALSGALNISGTTTGPVTADTVVPPLPANTNNPPPIYTGSAPVNDLALPITVNQWVLPTDPVLPGSGTTNFYRIDVTFTLVPT